jgi:putative SOS response-associated peptidase YedK
MCGRARLSSDYSEIRITFHIPPDRPAPNLRPNWNLASTQDIAIVRRDAEDGGRRLDVVRWGLLPFWAKDVKLSYSTFNARSEEIETKPAWRNAFKARRCLVPLDSFYEWKQVGPREKQPYAIARKDRGILAMAGLWERWKSPANEIVPSATIITCAPNALMAKLHNRMPVILNEAAWPRWLGEEPATADELKALLVACPDDDLTMWPVSKAVGNVKNNDPLLIEPVTLVAAGR